MGPSERRWVIPVHLAAAHGLSDVGREVEEALEAAFHPEGEITGAGTSMGVCHLDLEIEVCPDPDAALERLRRVLADLGVAEHAELNVSD